MRAFSGLGALAESDVRFTQNNFSLVHCGETMKQFVCLLILATIFVFNGNLKAEDRNIGIEKNVEQLASALDRGEDATSYATDSCTPYVFVMEENGKLLAHPTLAGENLKEKALPIFKALIMAAPEGVWVTYAWKGRIKHTYAKRTKSNLIVASGY
jgi:hypothetical protein